MASTEQEEEIRRYIATAKRRDIRWSAFGAWIGMTAVIAIALAVSVIDCNALRVPDDDATHVLEENGVTDVHLRGIDFGGCEQGEESREFDAKRDGRRVHGTVCCGIVRKACTVRWR